MTRPECKNMKGQDGGWVPAGCLKLNECQRSQCRWESEYANQWCANRSHGEGTSGRYKERKDPSSVRYQRYQRSERQTLKSGNIWETLTGVKWRLKVEKNTGEVTGKGIRKPLRSPNTGTKMQYYSLGNLTEFRCVLNMPGRWSTLRSSVKSY